MKLNGLIFLFFASSCGLIFLTLHEKLKPLNDERLEKIRLAKIQKVCMKSYPRERKERVAMRSFTLAQKEIDTLLKRKIPIFLKESYQVDENATKEILNTIVSIVNHVREDIVLSIETYVRKQEGSRQKHLILSQKRADWLKQYFKEETDVVFIVAIGYVGEETPSKDKSSNENREVKIVLKRIKQ